MHYSLPADTAVISFDELPTGLVGSPTPIAVQIQRASSGTIVLARTTNGVVERPAGSGNYVVTLVSPSELDDYLVVIDWSAGELTPATSRVAQLRVTFTLPMEVSGLGPLADQARAQLGKTFDALRNDPNYGPTQILGRVEVVKARTMTTPPAPSEEDALPLLVKDYLGRLIALELMPAAYAYWGRNPISTTTGNEPSESTTWPDPIKVLEGIEKYLLMTTRRDEAIVIPMLSSPRLREATDGPAIDEETDAKVTSDPHCFPTYDEHIGRTLVGADTTRRRW